MQNHRNYNRKRQYVIFYALWFFLISVGYSQTLQVDADLNAFKDSLKVMNHSELILAFEKNSLNDTTKTNLICEKFLLDLSNNIYNEKEKASAYYTLWSWKFFANEFTQSIYYANQSKRYGAKLKNKSHESLALNSIALSKVALGQYIEAVDLYQKALVLAKKAENKFLKAAIIGNLIDLKIMCKNYEEAIVLAEKDIQEIKNADREELKYLFPSKYGRLAQAYLLKGNIEKATHYSSLGKKAAQELKFFIKRHLILEARIEIHKKNYSKALEILDSIANMPTQDMNEHLIAAQIHLYKGKIYYQTKSFEKAIDELLALEAIQKKKHINRLNVQEGYSLLAKSYKAINNTKRSLLYYEKALLIFTKNEKERIDLITEIENKFDSKELEEKLKEEGLSDLKNTYENFKALQSEYSKLQEQKQRMDRYVMYGSCFVMILFILAFIFIYHLRRKNEQKFKLLLNQIEKKKEEKSLQKQALKTTSTSSEINPETQDKIIKGLKKLEEKEYFLNSDCSAINVAKKLKTNTTYLSKVIRSYYQKNFNTYINELRINYVLSRLKKDPKFRLYSIQSISQELGYKSQDSFTKYFKKHTGLLPSYFIKKLKKIDE